MAEVIDNDWLWALRVINMNQKALRKYATEIIKNRMEKYT